jgi:hypothetical protein
MNDRAEQLRAEIDQARQDTLETVAQLQTPPLEIVQVNDGWTARDLLAHLSSIELRIRAMCQGALEGRPWPAEDNSVDAYNARCVEERRSWSTDDLVAELRDSGRQTDQLLQSLTDPALQTTFTHPTRGEITVETMLRIIPRHLREHTAELRAAAER